MKSLLHKESDAESDVERHGHIQQSESDALAKRIVEVLGTDSVISFSRRCGVGESTLRNIIKSGASPRTDNLVAIADSANVTIEWLAAGRGPKRRGSVTQIAPPSAAPPPEPSPPIDLERLEMAIETVQEAISLTGRKFTPDKHAKIISIAYQLLENAEQRDNVVGMIKMAS